MITQSGIKKIEELNFGELTLEVGWRDASGNVVVVDKFYHINPRDIAHLPYPTLKIERE